jgi:hypothetical protein
VKIKGQKIDSKPTSDFIVFPRDSGPIAVKANAILDRDEFDKVCPMPKPPKKRIKGGQMVDDPEHPRYIAALNQHSEKFLHWLIITSLCFMDPETKEDIPIEWEKVSRTDSFSWRYWDDEFKESGFGDMERKRIFSMVISVNSLSEARLDEARNSFLQHREVEPDESSSLATEQSGTPSGEPANDSESNHQESQTVGTK